MISLLRGKATPLDDKCLLLDTGSVGYQVFSTPRLLARLKPGQELTLHTYLKVSDQAQELYGFADPAELALFKLLLTVNGVGPKSALGILAAAEPGEIGNAIAHGDTALLCKGYGIGAKTAERLVTELKDKVTATATSGDGEALSGLTALGYSSAEAREALRTVDRKLPAGEQIRAALKALGRR